MPSLTKCFSDHKANLKASLSSGEFADIERYVSDYRKTNADKPLIQKNLAIELSDMMSAVESDIQDIFDRVQKQIEAEEAEKPKVIGRVFLEKGGWRDITAQREIKRGKQKGKIEIVLLDGKKKKVAADAVRLSEAKEAVKAEKAEPEKPVTEDIEITGKEDKAVSVEPTPPKEKPDEAGEKEDVALYSKKSYDETKESVNALYMAKKRRPSKSKGKRSEGRRLRELFAKAGHPNTETVSIASSRIKNRKILKNTTQRLFKTQVVFFKTTDPKIDQINGVTFPENPNTVYINVSAQDPYFNVIGHETMHVLQEKHPDLYEKLDDLLRSDIIGFSKYVDALGLSRGDSELFGVDTEGAYREFYADFLGDQITNTDFWRKLYNRDATLTEKIINIVQAIIDRLVGAPRRFVSEDYFKDLNKAQDVLADVVKEFRERQSQGKPAETADTRASYSKKPDFKAIRTFLDGDPVSVLAGDEFQRVEGQSLIDRVSNWFQKEHNGIAVNPDLGEVSLTRRGVRDSIYHGLTTLKATAFAAVPDIISKGRVASERKDWKGRGYAGYLIVAPVRIANNDYVGIAVVRRTTGGQRYYLHEVVLKEKLRPSEFSTGASAVETGEPSGPDEGAIRNILREIYDVKDRKPQYQLKKSHPEFTEAAESIDRRDESDLYQGIGNKVREFFTKGPKTLFRKTGIIHGKKQDPDLIKGVRWLQTMHDLARNFPLMKRLFDVQIRREARANQMSLADRNSTEAFYILPQKNKVRVEASLLSEDANSTEYTKDQLRKKFGLADEEIKGHMAMRAVYNEKMDILITQMLSHVLGPEAIVTPLMVDAIKAGVTKKDFQKLMDDYGFKAFDYDRLHWISEWAKERKGYVPHKWSTPWVVKVTFDPKDPKKNYLLEVPTVKGKIAPSRGMRWRQANEAATQVIMKKFNMTEAQVKEMAEQGKTQVIESRDLPVDLFQGARMDVIQSIIDSGVDHMWKDYENALSGSQLDQIKDLKDQIRKSVEELYLAKGWGQHLIGRTGIQGFRTDIGKVTAEYLYGFNSFTAKGEAAKEFADVMKDIDPRKIPLQWTHGKEYVSDMLGDVNEAGWFKKIAGTWFLAGDLSAAALNMTQNWTHAVPLLRTIKGKKASEKDLLKAMTDIGNEYLSTKKSKKKLFSEASDRISEDEIKALKYAFEAGHLDPAFFGEVTGLHKNKIWEGFSKEAFSSLFKLFTGAEGWNRTSTYLAAYRRGIDAGMTSSGAIQKAVEITHGAHFVYGRGNRPLLARKTGAVGNVALTFMTYPINNLVFLKHRLEDIFTAVHQGDKAAVRQSMKVMGSNLGYLFAFGGLAGLPFAYLAQPILDFFGDDSDDDWEVELRKLMPKRIGRTVTRGIPAAFLGNDMSWRVQGTDVIGLPIGFQIVGMGKKRIEKSRKLWGQGEELDSIFHLMPDMIRNPYRAVVGFKEGGERPGRPPIKYTPYEALVKALSFTPVRESEAWKIGELTRKRRDSRLKKLDNLSNRFIIAIQEGDNKKRIAVLNDLAEYNKRQAKKGAEGVLLAPKDLGRSVKLRLRFRAKGYKERFPRYMRPYYREMERILQ